MTAGYDRNAKRRQLQWLARWLILIGAVLVWHSPSAAGWEPVHQVEIIVPGGAGGSADQIARVIQSIVKKYELVKQPIVVINKGGGDGSEAFIDMKASSGNSHKLLIASSSLFSAPLGTGIPFTWRDLTPVAMIALDEFVLWVNAEGPYQNVADYVKAIRSAPVGQFKMGGTGSKQEDQLIAVAIEKVLGIKFSYIPYKSGGDAVAQLASNQVQSTVNNPIEAVTQWRAGKVRPICVFDSKPLEYNDKIADRSWNDVPTCKSTGLDLQYFMLRGIFMPASASPEQVTYYIELLKRVRETPEWNALMVSGAFRQTVLTGADYVNWLVNEEQHHRSLMKDAGFLSAN